MKPLVYMQIYIYIKLFYMETHDVYMVEAEFLAPTTLMVHNS